MHIGAHVSCSGSLARSIDRAEEIGAEAIQIFPCAPQSWRRQIHDDQAIAAFRRRAAESGIEEIFLHAIYLINLAASDPVHLDRSVTSLRSALDTAARMGARGAIFHTGSHKGAGFEGALPQITGAISRVLEATPEHTWLIVENSAGMGGSIGSTFAELGAIVRGSGSERVKVCLDTCHLLAAGHEIRTADGLERTLTEFDRDVGLERLVAVHANDSKVPLGGGKDRHENVGEGHIGLDGFATLMGHRVFANVPFILEVPGFDGSGPDRRNIELLCEIRGRLGVAVPQRKPPASA